MQTEPRIKAETNQQQAHSVSPTAINGPKNAKYVNWEIKGNPGAKDKLPQDIAGVEGVEDIQVTKIEQVLPVDVRIERRWDQSVNGGLGKCQDEQWELLGVDYS